MRQYRQGDVLITYIGAFPNGKMKAAPKSRFKKDRFILVSGEKTGHSHTIEADAIEEVLSEAWRRATSRIYMRLGKTATLKHQEHDPIVIPPGTYVVQRQVEYAPDGKTAPVLD